MNSVCIIGRLTSDPDIKQGQFGSVAKYKLAVDRPKGKNSTEQKTDFIPCLCFGKSAEFAQNYLCKGMKIAVIGSIQTGSYEDRDGKTVYTVEVLVKNHEFCEKRAADNGSGINEYTQQNYPQQNNYSQNGSGYQNNYQQHPNNYQQRAPQNNYQQRAPQNNYQATRMFPEHPGYQLPPQYTPPQNYAQAPAPPPPPLPEGFQQVYDQEQIKSGWISEENQQLPF